MALGDKVHKDGRIAGGEFRKDGAGGVPVVEFSLAIAVEKHVERGKPNHVFVEVNAMNIGVVEPPVFAFMGCIDEREGEEITNAAAGVNNRLTVAGVDDFDEKVDHREGREKLGSFIASKKVGEIIKDELVKITIG